MGSPSELGTGHMYKELLREGQATRKDLQGPPQGSHGPKKRSFPTSQSGTRWRPPEVLCQW